MGLTLSLLAHLFSVKLFVEASICFPSTRLKAPWEFVYWYMLSAYQRIEPTLINGCGRKRGGSVWLEGGRDLVEEVTWRMESHQEELGGAGAFWGKITEQARVQFQKPFELLQVGWLFFAPVICGAPLINAIDPLLRKCTYPQHFTASHRGYLDPLGIKKLPE